MVGQVIPFEKPRRSAEEADIRREPNVTLTKSTGVTTQHSIVEELKDAAKTLVLAADRATGAQNVNIGTFKISMLPNEVLKAPIDAILEQDGDGFLARTVDLPLYGYGEDPVDAIDILKTEIESLYNDLLEDNNFTDDWLRIKTYLTSLIVNET